MRVDNQFLKPDRAQPKYVAKHYDGELDHHDRKDEPRHGTTDGRRELIDAIREAEHEGL